MENFKKEDEVKEELVENDDTRTSEEDVDSVAEQSVSESEQDAPQEPEEDQFEEPKEEMFTQSQVNEMVGRARREGRESAMKALFERYGVDTDDELNDLFGKGQTYADLNTDYESNLTALKDAQGENALLKSGICPERWEDAKAILSARGLDISEESLNEMLPTHPEWVKTVSGQPKQLGEEDLQEMAQNQGLGGNEQPAKLMKLGNDPSPKQEESDKEIAFNLFGFNK